jgi:hypothetical protein
MSKCTFLLISRERVIFYKRVELQRLERHVATSDCFSTTQQTHEFMTDGTVQSVCYTQSVRVKTRDGHFVMMRWAGEQI